MNGVNIKTNKINWIYLVYIIVSVDIFGGYLVYMYTY